MVKSELRLSLGYTKEDIIDSICAVLPVAKEEITDTEILKKALKLDGERAEYALTVGISLAPEREAGLLKMKKKNL